MANKQNRNLTGKEGRKRTASVYGSRPQVRYVRKKKISHRKFVTANRWKLIIVFSVLVLAMAALIVRLNYINLTSGEVYAKRVLEQLQYNGQTIPFRRGDITDRNGTVLATSEKVYNLIVDAYVINHAKVKQEGDCVEPTLAAIEKYFGAEGVNIEEVRKHIHEEPDSRYKVVIKHLSYDVVKNYQEKMAETDEKGNLTEGLYVSSGGVWFEEEYVRKYPYGILACDLIGFINPGNIGACGIEAYYNDELNGTDGRNYGYMTEDSLMEYDTISPVNGYTIVSTIDLNVQQIIQKHLYEFNEAYGSKNSAVIVQDAANGEILGMANYPYFNLNDPYDVETFVSDVRWEAMTEEEKIQEAQVIWRNFCVSDAYEPGSTMKTITMAAALEENVVSSENTFSCPGYRIYPDGNSEVKIGCTHPHGMVDLSGAIEQSCNSALMDVAGFLGKQSFSKYQTMFGLGLKTNIDLPGEANGILYPLNSMTQIDLATNSFGQNYTITMLQGISAFTSIVNGGSYYRPHVVKAIQSENGSVVQSFDKELVRTTVSETTSQWMRDALEGTVIEGTGQKTYIEGYRIGGKTGTAEKFDEYGNRTSGANRTNLVSFISAAPIDDPQIVVYVIIDEPDIGDQANSAIPTVLTRKIYEDLLPYLQIFPEGTVSESETEDMISSEPEETDESDDTSQTYAPESEESAAETDEEGNVMETSETWLTEAEKAQLIADYNALPVHREHIRK